MQQQQKVKVYAVMYNPCIYESSFGVISLYHDFQAAIEECNRLEQDRKVYWREEIGEEMPSYEEFNVKEYEVQ